MGYKINFYNTITGEYFLGDRTYETITQANSQAIFLQPKLSKAVVVDGVVEVNEERSVQIVKYDLTDDGKGKKYDGGKSMVGTLCRVFPRALLGIGQCIQFGTTKYPNPKNWQLVDKGFERYQDSMMRHYLKFQAGQEIDSETSLLHLKHMAWNALAILELYLMEHEDETLFK